MSIGRVGYVKFTATGEYNILDSISEYWLNKTYVRTKPIRTFGSIGRVNNTTYEFKVMYGFVVPTELIESLGVIQVKKNRLDIFKR